MRSTPLLIEASPRGGHIVFVRFDDGTAGEVDLSYLLQHGGVFETLYARTQQRTAATA